MADLIFKLVVSEDGKDVFTTPLSYTMVASITSDYPDTSESNKYFKWASKHAASSVRERVADKRSLSPDIVAALSKDASLAVLRTLAQTHPDFFKIVSQDLLEKLLKLDVGLAENMALNIMDCNEADATKLASLLVTIAHPEAVSRLASNYYTPPKVLKSLVNHPDLFVASAARLSLQERSRLKSHHR